MNTIQTLIELYDERPLENVLSTQVFAPERVVYVCPRSIYKSDRARATITNYLKSKGFAGDIHFVRADMYSTLDTLNALKKLVAKYPGAVIDITGGTDQALFAAGVLSADSQTPAFTYSRTKNRFFSVNNAPFGDEMACDVILSVEDCFVMAGGAVKRGRVDNGVLGKYMHSFGEFFELFMRFKKDWTSVVNWMQRASAPVNGEINLTIESPISVKGDYGTIRANPEALRAIEALGYIKNLKIEDDKVKFEFLDEQTRYWLRDVGSVLETYVYKACVDVGTFDDVCTSVVVDWEGDLKQGNVTNELDVVATKGVMPLFISCKTGEIKTEALNELAVLRDRFGGKIARAAIVSACACRLITRHRAEELGITVIDLNDLKRNRLHTRLNMLSKPL